MTARLERKYLDAFSPVSPHDGVLNSLVLPWVSAQTMSLFVNEVSRRGADALIVMVKDQAACSLCCSDASLFHANSLRYVSTA